MYEEELLYLHRTRGMTPAGPLGLHPYLGGGLPANLTDHLEKYRLGFHGKFVGGDPIPAVGPSSTLTPLVYCQALLSLASFQVQVLYLIVSAAQFIPRK